MSALPHHRSGMAPGAWHKRTPMRLGSTNTSVRVAWTPTASVLRFSYSNKFICCCNIHLRYYSTFGRSPAPPSYVISASEPGSRRGRALALSARFAPRPFSLALSITAQCKCRASPNRFAASRPNAMRVGSAFTAP